VNMWDLESPRNRLGLIKASRACTWTIRSMCMHDEKYSFGGGAVPKPVARDVLFSLLKSRLITAKKAYRKRVVTITL
jgi:hypothetical protein